jgi:Phage integrase, N-terminal SAM-like domain
MVRVQRIIVPDTQERCWVLFDTEHQPLIAPNQYLSYLHHLGRSPNTVRAYAHHLQAFSKFLCEEGGDWTTLSLTELAKFVRGCVESVQLAANHDPIRRSIQSSLQSAPSTNITTGLVLRQTSAGRDGSEQRVHTSRSCTTLAGTAPCDVRLCSCARFDACHGCFPRKKSRPY